MPEGVPPIRPIGIGFAMSRLLWRCLMEAFTFTPVVQHITAPQQYGVDEKGGGSKLVTSASILLQADPSLCILTVYMRNAFNEEIRAARLKKVWEEPKLPPLFYALHQQLGCETHIAIGGSNALEAPYRSAEGHVQGEVSAMAMTCLTTY